MIFQPCSTYSNTKDGVHTVCAISGTMILRPVANMFVCVWFGSLSLCRVANFQPRICYINFSGFLGKIIVGSPASPDFGVPLVSQPGCTQKFGIPCERAGLKHHKSRLQFDFFDQLRTVHVYGSKQE